MAEFKLHGDAMITEYELYSDERKMQGTSTTQMLLGGIVVTSTGRARLLDKLAVVRSTHRLSREMKWAKVSRGYLAAYRAWVNVFFDDPFARFSILLIDLASPDWNTFQPHPARRPLRDDRLASAFYQFLLVTFGTLRETKRWWVYPDAGLFSRENVLKRIEFLFNRTYKRAFGAKSSRIIRFASSLDSAKVDLVQLADVLLGALACGLLGVVPASQPRAELVRHCTNRIRLSARTRRAQEKLSAFKWVPPERFSYEGRGPRISV